MRQTNEVKNKNQITFTLRMNAELQDVVNILQHRTMLSKSSVVKLAIMTLYNQQMIQESEMKKIES